MSCSHCGMSCACGANETIKELEAENKKLALDYISAVGQAQMHLEALKELKLKAGEL